VNNIAMERWLEVRRRMFRKVDAVLWQDIGVPSPAREGYADWILDRIFKEEYLAVLSDDWTVWRQDDNGNRFIVQRTLTYHEAKALVSELEAKAHKQFYWLEPAQQE
jgi:hypothetical protein